MRAALAVLLLAMIDLGFPRDALAASPLRVDLVDADAGPEAVPATAPIARTVRGDAAQIVLPYREHGSWLRITLESVPAEPRLVVNGVAMGRLVLVLPAGEHVARDKMDPREDPSASFVAAVFALPASAGPGTALWLHSSDRHTNLLDLRLESASEWRSRERATIAFALALYGALSAFVIIGATYWAILRERMFADHALYLVCLIAFMAMSAGLFYAAFPGGFWARLGVHAQWGFAASAIGFAVGFATRFLDVARRMPRAARGLERVRVALLAVAIAITFSPWALPGFGAAMGLVLLAINLALVGLGIHSAAKGNRYAWYFLLGWVPLTFSTTMRALQATGLVELRYEFSLLYALGAVWEAVVLTAGIADRALSFRRERDLAHHLAQHDGLTGVLNRRAAEARLAEAFVDARARGGPLAVFFLDLDRFKSINDEHGHAGGDSVLVATARRIARQLRAGDALGRWGGEEFVAVVAATPDAARATCERIRRAIEAEPVHVGDAIIPVTVSAGVAILGPGDADSVALVRRADDALYRAKEKGRNRVEEAEVAISH